MRKDWVTEIISRIRSNKICAIVIVFSVVIAGMAALLNNIDLIWSKLHSLFYSSQINQDKRYSVTLIFPSRMSDAKIFVDDEHAKIIKQTPTSAVVLIVGKEYNHKITIKNEEIVCNRNLLIQQDNLIIPMCQ